jgi:arylsulfatase A-like enzyme
MPALYHDNHAVRPPRSVEDGYHLSADLADRAIEFLGDLRAVDSEKPFFLYFCTGACHSPHHAPPDWIERYKGRFSIGWDRWREETYSRQLEPGVIPKGTKLSGRPPWVPAWESLNEREKALAERFMECFAAYLSYTDAQIGRLLDFLDDTGDADNTLVIVVSDNGASSEGGKTGTINEGRLSNFDSAGIGEMYRRVDEIGGPLSHNNYPWGWTMAGNTPLKRWKREVHEGGVADPCIVRLPRHGESRSSAGIRRQFAHAIDVLPTVLELTGVAAPESIGGVAQSRIDGTSFAYLLGERGSEEQGRHATQYFEMLGSRAIYHNGWKAVTFHPVGPMYDDGLSVNAPFDDDIWELYHVEEDFSEVDDLAEAHPERLKQLIDLWWDEARRNDVLPLDNRPLEWIAHPKPDPRRSRQLHRYFQGGAPVPETAAPRLCNRSHVVNVLVDVSEGDVANGALLALGCALGGWSFHLLGGRLRYVHNLYGRSRDTVETDIVLGSGRHALSFAFEANKTGGGKVALAIDEREVATGAIERFTPAVFNEVGIGVTCGYEWGPAVGEGYSAPFTFNGKIVRAELTTTGPVLVDLVLEFASILARQ